jgi:hypothetical protein
MRQALIALVLAPSLFISAHASAAGGTMDKAAAKVAFKAALSKDGGLRSYHHGQLLKAGVKSTAVGGSSAFAALMITGRSTHSMSTAIGTAGAVGTAAGVAHFKISSLPAARSNTVAMGVARGTIKPAVAAKMQQSGFVDGRWHMQLEAQKLTESPAKRAKR